MKQGVLLLNFGGPWTLEDVRPFLYRLFNNPAILVGVRAPFRQLLAYTIARSRAKASIETYRAIGGGSPQLRWTRIQAEGLERLLNTGASASGVESKVAIGMLSSTPYILNALQELRDWGAEKVVLFPQFPHYSTTTTASCLTETHRCLRKMNWAPPIREITRWPDHPSYIRLLRKTVDEALAQAEAERAKEGATDPIHVLFSAHSLPMKIIERGDPYPQDIQATIQGISSGLKQPWSLSFQSRNGRMPWLTPYTEDELKRLAQAGLRRVVVVPVSFVSDHIETLWELDQLYADMARKDGIKYYYRARAFNGDPEFQSVLLDVLRAGEA